LMGVEEDLRLILFRDLIGYPLYPIVSLLMPGGKISCLLFFIKDISIDQDSCRCMLRLARIKTDQWNSRKIPVELLFHLSACIICIVQKFQIRLNGIWRKREDMLEVNIGR